MAKSKTRKHADIISSLSFDEDGNLPGFENPANVTLPGLEVTGNSIFNGNIGVVGNAVFTGATIDIKQGGIFLGSDSDSFNGTDSDDVWTNYGTTNQIGKTYLRGNVDVEGTLNVKSSGTITFNSNVTIPNLTMNSGSTLTSTGKSTFTNLTTSNFTIGGTTVSSFNTFTIEDSGGSAQFTGKTFN